MSRATPREGRRRWVLLAGALVVVLAALGLAASGVLNARRFLVDDFVEYWAAGRLNLTGGDPYAPDALLPLQRSAGLEGDDPVMMWNPPWTLALVMPFALPAYRIGRLLWLLLNLALLIESVTYIWWSYRGPVTRRWVALVVLATYVPALFVLRMGQITPLMVAGILGFLHLEGRRRWFLAGVFAALVAVKPHLLYLFWIALILWVIERRACKVLLGALGGLALGTAVAWLINPDVIVQYTVAATRYPPGDWATPTVGGFLRLLFGYERRWLQFLPPLAGIVWFLQYWRRKRLTWRWAEQMPLLLAVCLATAPYGWEYDLVLLLLPVLQVAMWLVVHPWSRASTALVIGYAACNGLALAMNIVRVNAVWYLWLGPAWLLWYLLARRRLRPLGAAPSDAAPVLLPADPGSQKAGP